MAREPVRNHPVSITAMMRETVLEHVEEASGANVSDELILKFGLSLPAWMIKKKGKCDLSFRIIW